MNALDMSGYDASARSRFVSWNRSHVSVIERVAVVTNRPLWHVVTRAMGLASTQQMRPFADVASARAWLSAES